MCPNFWLVVYVSSLLINAKPTFDYNLFESLTLRLFHPAWKTLQQVQFVIVYHIPGPYSEFDYIKFFKQIK